MKFHIDNLIAIKAQFGNFDLQFDRESVQFRFGFWKQVDTEKLDSMLPWNTVLEEVEHEDEDCNVRFAYVVKLKK